LGKKISLIADIIHGGSVIPFGREFQVAQFISAVITGLEFHLHAEGLHAGE
jgi:hypothetical protein